MGATTSGTSGEGRARMARIAVAASVLGILAWMTWTSLGFSVEARRAPLVVGIPATLMALILFVREIRGSEEPIAAEETAVDPSLAQNLVQGAGPGAGGAEHQPDSVAGATAAAPAEDTVSPLDGPESGEGRKPDPGDQLSTLGAALWITFLAAMFLSLGFLWTTLLFPPIFMRIYGHERWRPIVITTLGVFVATYGFFIVALEIQIYRGFLDVPGLDQLF